MAEWERRLDEDDRTWAGQWEDWEQWPKSLVPTGSWCSTVVWRGTLTCPAVSEVTKTLLQGDLAQVVH